MSMFVTRKWIKLNDLSNGQYSVNKNVRFKSRMLRPDLRAYSNAYIVAKRTISLEIGANNNIPQKYVEFKSNAPFRSCISKINSTFVENADDLDILIVSIVQIIL